MSSQPKLRMMAWTGLGWRSWGAEAGRSKANRVKPEDEEEEEEDVEEEEACYAFVDLHTLHSLRHVNENHSCHFSSPTSFLSNQNPLRETTANKQVFVLSSSFPFPSLVLLTCSGVRQRCRGGLREAHVAHEWVEVCPESRCHR